MAVSESTSRLIMDGNADGLVAAMVRAESAVRQQTGMISSHFNTLSGSINKVIGLVGTGAAVLAGGSMFKSFVSETQAVTGETLKLAKVLGITTEEAGAYRVALHAVSVDQEVLEGVSAKLSARLATNQGAFDQLGIKVRDSRGELLPMSEIVLSTVEKLNSLEAGSNRNAAGALLLGRSWKESMGILKLNSELIAESRHEMEELGLTVGPERVAQFVEYRKEMKYLGLVAEGMKVQVGNQLVPILISLGQWMHSTGPAALFVFGGALKGVVTFVEYATLGVGTLWETWKALWGQFSVTSVSLVKIITQIISGDFSGAWQTAKQGIADFAQYGVTWFDNIGAAAERTNTRVGKMWGLVAQTPGKPKPHTGEKFDPAPEAEKAEDVHRRQMSLEDARLKALMEGFKASLEGIKENGQLELAEEEYWLKSGLVGQTAYQQQKYQIEKRGLEDSVGIVNEEIAAIEASRLKKVALAANPEEREKVIEEAKKETAEKTTERQKLYNALKMLQLKFLTEEAAEEKAWRDEEQRQGWEYALKADEMNRQARETARGIVAQTEEDRLRYLGLEVEAVDAKFQHEAQKLEEDYQLKLAYARQIGADTNLIDAQYQAQRDQLEQQHEEKRLKAVQDAESKKRMMVANAFGNMATVADAFYQLSGKQSKEALRAYQVMKSGETIVTTADAAMKSYDALASIPYVGPALGAAAAAAAIAAGAVQMQSIWSVGSDGSGGSLSTSGFSGSGSISGGYASDRTVTQPVPQGAAQGNSLTLVLNNPIGERRWFEDNLPAIMRDFASRNVNTGVVYQ
jgi:hypothetical protein